jgi:predicted ATPase
MNEKLIVKDFGPIKNAELDLKKVTIFIGPQGSGKSALAKLVAIFNNGEFLFDAYIGRAAEEYFKKFQSEYFININTSVSFNTNNYEAFFKVDSLNFTSKKENTFFQGIQVEQFTNYTLESLKGEWQRILERAKNGSNEQDLILRSEVLPFVQKRINRLISKIKYLPTERFLVSSISDSILGLLSAEVALQKSTIEFGRDFEISRSNIPTLFIDYLNITYKYENGRNLVFHNETDSMPLSASASGHQSTIPLHLTVEHFSKDGNTHFIVEEPELNLFPTTQKELVGYLADKCTQNGNELLMTTHSPYILSAINNLIFAYKVAHEVPEKAEEVAQIIPREQWLNPDDVAAYYVADGTVTSIIHEGEGLIGENELDAISEDISGERDQLFKILRSKKRETVH